MGIPKGPTKGGSGGKRGHSNMEHWGDTDEVKRAARQRRRLDATAEVVEQEGQDRDKSSDLFPVDIAFHSNGEWHKDMFVRVNSRDFVCDTYWLLVRADSAWTESVVRRVLGCLLDQWIAAVRNMPKRGVVYLPFDYSDQCSRWLRIQRNHDQVKIASGSSRIEAASMSPLDISKHLTAVGDWSSETERIEMSLNDLLCGFERIRVREGGG